MLSFANSTIKRISLLRNFVKCKIVEYYRIFYIHLKLSTLFQICMEKAIFMNWQKNIWRYVKFCDCYVLRSVECTQYQCISDFVYNLIYILFCNT